MYYLFFNRLYPQIELIIFYFSIMSKVDLPYLFPVVFIL